MVANKSQCPQYNVRPGFFAVLVVMCLLFCTGFIIHDIALNGYDAISSGWDTYIIVLVSLFTMLFVYSKSYVVRDHEVAVYRFGSLTTIQRLEDISKVDTSGDVKSWMWLELKFSDGGSVTVDSYYINSARFFKAVGEQLDSIGYQLTDKQRKWFTSLK